MKLFVWKDVLCDYSCGVIAVIANNVEEARELIRDAYTKDGVSYTYEPWEIRETNNSEPKVYDLSSPEIVAIVYGGM